MMKCQNERGEFMKRVVFILIKFLVIPLLLAIIVLSLPITVEEQRLIFIILIIIAVLYLSIPPILRRVIGRFGGAVTCLY